MTTVWQTLIGVAAGLVVLWLALLALLWYAQRNLAERTTLGEVWHLLPDVVALLRGLAVDPTVARGVRVRLVLMLAYLLFPIDIVPDVIPVLGYLDDAIVVLIALRSVLHHAGPDALSRHWRGTTEGLRVLLRLAGATTPARQVPVTKHGSLDDPC